MRVLLLILTIVVPVQAEKFRCRGKKATPFSGMEGIRPSDTRFISNRCRVGAPLKVSGYTKGQNRCYNFSMTCGLAGSKLTVFNKKGKYLGTAIPRSGCPNGRATYDLPKNALELANRTGKAGYLIAQMKKRNERVRCYAFRPTCSVRFAKEYALDSSRYAGVDLPSGAKPACGKFKPPKPIAPKKQ